MKRIALSSILIAATSLAQTTPVVKPRPNVHDYTAVKELQTSTLGATQLSAKQIRKEFVSNLGKAYVVVEIGVYPNNDTKVSPHDFALREQDAKDTIPPADPKLLASRINDNDQKGTDVAVHPVAGVSYSTGPSPYDPYDRGGWRTESGVMVGVNDKKKDPKTSNADREAMAAELSEKGLPEVVTSKAVAGYLYFNAQTGRKIHYQLEYQGPNGLVVIPLPTPAE